MRLGISAWLGAWLLACGCGNIGHPAAFALYPHPEQRRDPAELAQLQGPVATVDDVDVEAFGTVFDLLPGCHVVGLRRKVGQSDVSGAWVGELGPRYYAFHMRPGYLYVIDIQVRFRGASHGTMTITAEEHELRTNRTVAQVPPVSSQADVDACRSWDGGRPSSVPSLDRPPPGDIRADTTVAR